MALLLRPRPTALQASGQQQARRQVPCLAPMPTSRASSRRRAYLRVTCSATAAPYASPATSGASGRLWQGMEPHTTHSGNALLNASSPGLLCGPGGPCTAPSPGAPAPGPLPALAVEAEALIGVLEAQRRSKLLVRVRKLAGGEVRSKPFYEAGLECIENASPATSVSKQQWEALCTEARMVELGSRAVAELPDWVAREAPALAALLRRKHWLGAPPTHLVAEVVGLVFSNGKRRGGGSSLPYTRELLKTLLEELAPDLGLDAPHLGARPTRLRLLTEFVAMLRRATAAHAEQVASAAGGAAGELDAQAAAKEAKITAGARSVVNEAVKRLSPCHNQQLAALLHTGCAPELKQAGPSQQVLRLREKLQHFLRLHGSSWGKQEQPAMLTGYPVEVNRMLSAALEGQDPAIDRVLQRAAKLIGGGVYLAAWVQELGREPATRNGWVHVLAKALWDLGSPSNSRAWITENWGHSAGGRDPSGKPLSILISCTNRFKQQNAKDVRTGTEYELLDTKHLTGLAWSLDGGAVRDSVEPAFSSGGGSGEDSLAAAVTALLADVAEADVLELGEPGHALAYLLAWLTSRGEWAGVDVLMAKGARCTA
ncbi:hypothetical protein HYH03_009098 [Edaphochlamys debaryana]|uniref:Uncharacterized protein n=1 Tax=Edaphochlamys debaryana TaxID=47281 RepID=A0A835Y110_9CHLO|nr:hypothetical protein HYH03_009098 [Edaphochlamys debaryana]|eukprot:KAG2492683.1 hypothetical protein HYH03_009098 [Edaphochlamys debaryana]